MAGQQVDVLWFDHMGVFSEPIFNFSFVRLTLKQVATLFGGLLFAYALASGVDQIAGALVGCLALLITFYRPRVMPLEQYIAAAMRFLVAKNHRIAEKKRVAALMGQSLIREAAAERESTSSSGGGTNGQKKDGLVFPFLFRKRKRT
jgi:hypothetical protein